MTVASRFRLALVLVLVLVVQLSLAPRLTPAGVHADLLLLLAVAGGIAWGPERGALLGAAAGLCADLFQQTPFGLSMLVFCLVGFGVGSLQSGILRAAWWIPVLTAAGASAVGVALWALAATVVGEAGLLSSRLAVIAGVVAVLNGPAALPVLRLLSWAGRGSELTRRPA